MNIEARFYEWFEKRYGKPEEQTVFFRVALEAYKQGLKDFLDVPLKELEPLGILSKTAHTAAEMLADPDGYDEYDPMVTEAKASAALVEAFEPRGTQTGRVVSDAGNSKEVPRRPRGRDLTLYPHCSKHPRYHGLKYPQARKEGWTGFQTCAECQEVYEEVQKVKKAAKEPGRVALP